MRRVVTVLSIGLLLFPTIPAWAEDDVSLPPVEDTSFATEATPTPSQDTQATTTESEELSTSLSVSEPTTTTSEPVELIVKLTDDSKSSVESLENLPNVTVTDTLADGTVLAEASSTASAELIADQLESLPSVAYAEPNYTRTALTIPANDTLRSTLWGLDNTGQTVNGSSGTSGDDIDEVLALGLSFGTSTVVAVIDSGVLYTHPDLDANMWEGTSCLDDQGASLGNCIHGYDFADNDTDPAPVAASSSYQHGTHVAGTIAAEWNNNAGVIGVAPSTKIMALRFGFDVASEVRAIDFARENGVKIINASFGGTDYSQAEYDAIERFTDDGGIFVAAAGNSTTNNDVTPLYPAAYDLPGIISVAATDQDDHIASFSNYGTTTVDIGAPGVNIASTYVTGTTPGYAYADGTSMAAPHVAGTLALIESLYPALSSTEVKQAILDGGETVNWLSTTTSSGKRLNAYRALLAAGGTDFVPPVITLTGSNSISLTVGDPYTELGATAFDAHDGTTTVSIGGDTVDVNTANTYHVTYDAVDLAGNHATQVIRTVTLSPRVRSSGGGGGHSTSRRSGGGGGGAKNKVVANPARPALSNSSTPPASTGPASTPTGSFTRILTVGSTGPDVTSLQQLLTTLGLYTGPVTGYFGPLTQTAVRAYQARHGLDQVGFTGPMTRSFLNQGI